jgi:integrase
MRNGLRVNSGLHVTSKRLTTGVRWYVYAWRGGPCVHSCDGTKPTISKAMLDDAAEARKEATAAPENTLARLIDDYKASPQYMGRADSTLRDYRRSLDRIGDKFGDAPLDVFEDRQIRGDILKWRDEWQGQPRTADKLTVMFGTLLEWGVEHGRVSINVAAGIKTLHDADRSEIIWEQRHWDAITPHAHDQLMQALRFDSMTGFRLGDLVKVQWEHVKDKAIIFVTAKRKRRVVVPIFPELRAFLDSLPHRTGPILLNSYGNAWTSSGLGGVYQKAKNKAGIDVHVHDLRGTYATWLCVKGLTDDEIARTLGWSPKIVAELRSRYVDEARVVVSIIDRLSA